MPNFEERRISGLDLIEVPGDPGGPVILFFHGYGADALDLFPLSGVYKGSPAPRWIFPNGPMQIPIAPGFMGRAWFSIDIEELQRAIHFGDRQAFLQAFPSELLEAREMGERLIAELDIPLSKLFLGGFSQGAILATEIALNAMEKPAGLVILSGTLINEKNWNHLAHLRAGMPFFQSHGESDPLLPWERAKALEQLLQKGGLKGKLSTFPGGHEIPQKILGELKKFFEDRLNRPEIEKPNSQGVR